MVCTTVMQNSEKSNEMSLKTKMNTSFSLKMWKLFCHGPTFLFFHKITSKWNSTKTPVISLGILFLTVGHA